MPREPGRSGISAGAVRNDWSEEETEVAEEYLTHALALRQERADAAREGREARILELLQLWGGSTIAYRKRLIDSPSYTLNHEEVEKALEEGIRFAEGLTPLAIDVDEQGAAPGLRVSQQQRDDTGAWTEFVQPCPGAPLLPHGQAVPEPSPAQTTTGAGTQART